MFTCSNKHLYNLRESCTGKHDIEELDDAVNLTLKRLALRLNRRVSVSPLSKYPSTSSATHNPPDVLCLLQLCNMASLLESLPFSATTNAYVVTRQQLNFDVCPRSNVLSTSMPNVQVHNSKSLPEGIKWYILCTYERIIQAVERNITYKNRLVLMRVIVQMVAYRNGYDKPPVTKKQLQSIWSNTGMPSVQVLML